MKKPPLFLALAAVAAGMLSSANAQNATWTGAISPDFGNASNWSVNPFASSNGTLQINGPGAQGNATLTNATVTFTSAAGKVSLSGATPMTLTGGTITLFNGAIDGILANTANVTVTIGSNVILGDGGNSTISLTSNVIGANLKVTGNITGGSGNATAGNLTLSLGSNSAKNGDYDISGNITKGGAARIILNHRGNGTATLSGTNTLDLLFNNEAGGVILINGGNTTIANTAIGSTWGGGSVLGVVRVSAGTLAAGDARLGSGAANSILVDGGNLTVNAAHTAGNYRLSMGGNTNSGNQSFTMTSGSVDVYGNLGVRFGGDNGAGSNNGGATNGFTASQSGGNFTITGGGSVGTGFSLGSNSTGANITNTYNFSGGTLTVNSQTAGQSRFDLGASSDGVSKAVFNMSGTSKLIVSANPTGSQGISGAQSGAVQVFSFTGGTLVAGRIDATNLRGSLVDANGTFINNGGSIAPGDIGTSGRTAVVGGLTLTSGTLLLDIGGTNAATAFQGTSSQFDNITVTGALSLGGNLTLSLINGYNPVDDGSVSFTIFTAGSISNTFAGLSNNSTFSQGGQSWRINYNASNVVLTAVPEPATFALLAAGMAAVVLYRRRRRD